MKKINLFLTILAAAAGFTNCTKTDLVVNKETGNGGTVVYATTDAATKTTLANDYKVLWSEGDKITFVKDGAANTTYTYTLSSGAGTTNGTFTCDGSQTPENGTYTVWYNYDKNGKYWYRQDYVNNAADISEAPMKATNVTVSDGIVSDISFKNEGGILRYTVKGNKTIKIKSIKVQSASRELDVTLNCGDDGVALTEEGTVFNIVVKPGTYNDDTLTFSATDFTFATKKASSFVVKKNTVSLVTFEAADLLFLPAGALPGVFTVSDPDSTPNTGDEKKVRFSQGNLKYDRGKTKWEFYKHQYDYATHDDYQTVSLFPWGYDASETIQFGSSAYAKTHTNKGDKLVYNKAFSEGGDDWGVAYCESNNITVGIWRMLSKEEWQYLFNHGSYQSDIRKNKYKWAKVNGVNGYVIAPDDFTGTLQESYANDVGLADAGNLVFLPAAGYYNSGSFSGVESDGYYWSSSADSSGSYYLYINSADLNPGRGDDVNMTLSARSQNYSVRLVTEVK